MNPVHGSPQGLAVAAADDPVFFTTPKPEAVEDVYKRQLMECALVHRATQVA